MPIKVILGILLSFSVAHAELPDEVIRDLKALQEANRLELDKMGELMTEALNKTMDLKMQNPDAVDSAMDTLKESMDHWIDKKNAGLMKARFFDQLISLVASKYHGQPLKTFLSQTFLEMASSELEIGSPNIVSQDSNWYYFVALSVAMREVPERIEKPIQFLDDYLKLSPMNEPIKLSDFMDKRAYINSNQPTLTKHPTKEQTNDPKDDEEDGEDRPQDTIEVPQQDNSKKEKAS